MRSTTRSGASRATSAAMSGSQSPAPAAIVSRACACQVSPSATAAAMPPCAQTLEPVVPGRAPQRIRAGKGASFSAVNSPASPAPRMSAPSASIILSMRLTTEASGGGSLPDGSHLQHALDGLARAHCYGWIDRHFDGHCFKRVEYLGKRDALHVRAEIAGPHEINGRKFGRDI